MASQATQQAANRCTGNLMTKNLVPPQYIPCNSATTLINVCKNVYYLDSGSVFLSVENLYFAHLNLKRNEIFCFGTNYENQR